MNNLLEPQYKLKVGECKDIYDKKSKFISKWNKHILYCGMPNDTTFSISFPREKYTIGELYTEMGPNVFFPISKRNGNGTIILHDLEFKVLDVNPNELILEFVRKIKR